MNNNSRDEILKTAAVIMLLVLIFLPVVVKTVAAFLALIYIIFDMVGLKRNGFPI